MTQRWITTSHYQLALVLGYFIASTPGNPSLADTLLLAKWDDTETIDATYSLRGELGFRFDRRWCDHRIEQRTPLGAPHTLSKGGRWGGGLCCRDADNARTDGNGNLDSRACGGWFSMKDNFNLNSGTIEFWFKPDWDPSESESSHTLFTTGSHVGPGTGNQSGISIVWYDVGGGDGRLQGSWTNYTGNANPGFVVLGEQQLKEGDFSRNSWHHLAFSWDSRGGCFFVDGRRLLLNRQQNLALREYPEGQDFILGGRDSSIHLYPPAQPANGIYDNFRVSDRMLYAPDRDFTVPGDFAVPRLPLTRMLDLGQDVAMELVLVSPIPVGPDSPVADASVASREPVTITRPYYIGRYEVTQLQWETLMHSNPSRHRGPHLPVHQVSRSDCLEFLRRLRLQTESSDLRLPTEAEWEYACRAGGRSQPPDDDPLHPLSAYAWFQRNSDGKPHQVGTRRPNAWGLYDMQGNVQEWCHDPFVADRTALGRREPLARGSGSRRGHALRGGAWSDPAEDAQLTTRRQALPVARHPVNGFRCLLGKRLEEGPAMEPLTKPIVVWGDAGGGEVHAQCENCLPNIEHAMGLGLTGIEIDMRPTADGQIVLWHEPGIDDRFYLSGGGQPAQRQLAKMTLDQVKQLRYQSIVAGRPQELRLLTADQVIASYKHQTNFYLDMKSVPVAAVIELIAKHRIEDRVVVGSFDLEALRQVKLADPRIAVELAAGLLGTQKVLVRAVSDLRAIGGEFLSCDGWRTDMVAYCHQRGIAVRPFGGSVGFGDAAQFLGRGVDAVNGDYPERLLEAVQRLWGPGYLPTPGQSIREILESRRATPAGDG
ncbi:MAG: SUMF1/EgtB/PvdO family nonheme iron enzyme [Planctomycetota bacterium]|nr:SUMF1/EgtB/PvdO family nonheme iron enzyme [Planctomycetota bacterium]